jgi:hypothetical protein
MSGMAKKDKTVWEKNFAENREIREMVADYFIPKLKEVKDNRKELEQSWMRFFKMWNVTHDENHGYSGRAKLYVPEVRKNVEAQARQLTEAAFPNEDFFDVSPGDSGTKDGAQIWKSMMRWYMENTQIRVKYHVFARQETLYGTSPVYIPWNRKVEHAFRSAKDPKTGKIRPTKKQIEIFNGPDFIVKDLFKWYALNPHKADILEDGCAEYQVLNRFDLLLREKNGELYGRKDVEQGNTDAFRMEELENDIQQAEAIGLQVDNRGYAGEASLRKDEENKANNYLVCTIYTKMVLPQACEPDEDPRFPISVKIEIYNNEHVGLVRRNPFFHQRPPYLVGKYILPQPDFFYGQGIPWAIQYMQYEINSKAEQSMDSATLSLNPIAIVDPGLAGQTNEFNVEPGAIWWANPQGVKFAQVPDVTATGYAAIGQLRSQMQDYSDRSPALPSQLMGKSRTATQSEMVFDTISTDNKSFQLQNEILVLQPMLEMWESLADQNVNEDQVIMILGARASDWKRALVTKNQTLGSYRYFWKVTNIHQNRQVLARQLIDAIKVAGSLPPQSGLRFDFGEAYKMLWVDGFGLPDGAKILGLPEDMKSQSPEVEHKMLDMGLEIEVLPHDDDEEHMKSHDKELGELKDEEQKKTLMIHIIKHKQQLQMKMQAIQQQMMQQQMMQQQLIQQGGQAPKRGQMVGSGNRTQLSPNANAGDMASGVRA